MSQEAVTHLTVLLPVILLTLSLALFVINDSYIGRAQRKIMLLICALVFVLIAQNCMALLYETRYADPPARTVWSIVGSIYLDYQVGRAEQLITFLTYAIGLSSVFYYIWLHQQFLQEHENDLMAVQRIRIMMTQIQPHFLFNSLEAIRRLYRKDPEKADGALLKFERYLRGNIDSLTQKTTIPFRTELEHTKLYLELEQLRFQDELRIVYDLRCEDFPIPPLTLQPLAENAVRHGVRGSKSGVGTLAIASREYEDRYEVSVTDDGDGFDPEAVSRDGQPHIGLSNVRERLELIGAGLRIGAGPDGGTQAVIIIPKTQAAGR